MRTGMRREWMWISAVGLGACSSDWVEPDAANVVDAGPVGSWQRCCSFSTFGGPVQTRGSGDSMECFCEPGWTCNYVQSCHDAALSMDTGTASGADAGPNDDTGFADAGPIEDAAIDALIIDAGEMP